MRRLPWIYRSAWARIFIPLGLTGLSALAINLLSWDLTKHGSFEPKSIWASPFLYLYVITGSAFAAYELMRAKLEAPSLFRRKAVEALLPHLNKRNQKLIAEGNVAGACKNVQTLEAAYEGDYSAINSRTIAEPSVDESTRNEDPEGDD